MDPTDSRLDISLDVGGGASEAELDELTAALRPELVRLDVDRVIGEWMARHPRSAVS